MHLLFEFNLSLYGGCAMTDRLLIDRELLADLLGNDHDKRIMAERHLLAMLANAPSPAGVDGLEVVAFLIGGEPSLTQCPVRGVVNDPLCRLSSAQAIIDGLRGEVGAQRIKTCTALKERNDAREERDSFQRVGIRAMEERDHLAQCLKFARTTMAVVANNANLRGVEYRSLVTEVKRIDAALSAVCAASPNIAPTSEHNGS